MNITAYDLAMRFAGVKETPGAASNPAVLSMLRLDQAWPVDDSVPWCGAFTSYIAWLLRLPRSKSLGARTWLEIGTPVPLEQAEVGFDVVVLQRGTGKQPGPDVIKAPGHVGFFAGRDGNTVLILGGNQSDSVSVASFPTSRVLGVRRLA